MKFSYISGLCFLFINITIPIQAQLHDSLARKPIKSAIIISDNISGDFSFVQNSDYPFPFYEDEKTGKLINGLDENIKVKKKDVEKLYFTANCTTNHQGGHLIRYCDATLKGDTLQLDFSDCDAAYHGWLEVILVKDSFQSQWYCDYIYSIPEQELFFGTVKQKLEINSIEFEKGMALKGRIDLTFNEYFSAPCFEPRVDEYYVNGLFETTIK